MQSGIIDTYVGGGNGDGAPAIAATIDPRGLTLVGNPNAPDLYIADSSAHRVRRVDGDTGLIETIAGNGVGGFSGDGGQAQNASLFLPFDVAVDGAGNVYIADLQNNRIRKVATDGRISTFAGNGQQSYTGEGIATQEALNQPYGVAVGPDGNVYIADTGNNRIRRVSPPGCAPSNCTISTVAGNGSGGLGGEGGPATSANLTSPSDVAFDANGVMYIVDRGSHRIRRVANGVITTVAGGGTSLADGVPGIAAALNAPSQVDVDSNGNVYIADTNYRRIRMLQAGTYTISTVAGTGNAGSTGDGGHPKNADLISPFGVVASTPGTFWIAQGSNVPVSQYNRVRKVTNSSVINSVVGGGMGDGGAAINALVDPQGSDTFNSGGALPDLYFADGANNVVRVVDGRTATIRTLAGTGLPGYSGDGGAAVNARLNLPTDVARDPSSGAIYIADTINNVIRKVGTNGTIITAAGDGGWGFDGDGSARQVHLAAPVGIDVDQAGALYIADTQNNRVRKVVGDQISTVAGNGNWSSTGDNGPAREASLRSPEDVVVADDGTLYVSDTGSNRIRRISNNTITTVVGGSGLPGFAGDGGLAINAKLTAPSYLTLDQGRNLFIADSTNRRIRRVDAGSQVIETVAGNGTAGDSGDGGVATAASFSSPSGVAIDPTGVHMFISANVDGRIRHVQFGGPVAPTPTPTPAPSGSISGRVFYYSDNRVVVPNVGVGLVGPQSQIALTNSNGAYSASVAAANWEIRPTKIGGRGFAVSSLDAARVLQVVAGTNSMNGLQRLACDVTGDGSVSALDGARILQFSAGSIDQLPAADLCGSDWLFNPRPAAAQNQSTVPPSVNGSCRQGKILLSPLVGAAQNQDFDGILLGDCTGNWTTSGAAFRRLSSDAIVRAGSLRRTDDDRLRLLIYVQGGEPFNALDIELSYDSSALKVYSAKPRGAATDALYATSTKESDIVSISMASAEPIDAGTGSVLAIEFTAGDGLLADGSLPRLLSASIDEQPVRVMSDAD